MYYVMNIMSTHMCTLKIHFFYTLAFFYVSNTIIIVTGSIVVLTIEGMVFREEAL